MHIHEVVLETTSIQRTRLFYNKTLELPVVQESEELISFQAGATKLTFHLTLNKKPFYHIAFNVTNNKFSDSFEWINKKLDILPVQNGLPVASYPEWNAESFYFYDNAGSILEFIVRFDLPYYSNNPFSPADIKEISEVGIVTNNVSDTARDLHDKYGIPYFAKSKSSEHFAAMGDDYGLLIITGSGRHWVPTHKAAEIFTVTVLVENMKIEFA